MGSRIVYIYTAEDLARNILSSDILMRLCALGLSIYYIVNIFLLPHRLARHANVPRYLLGYCISIGLSVVFYTFVAIFYDQTLLALYIVLFTVLNLYLTFRTLETLALELPRPVIREVSEEQEERNKEQDEEDFNEANLHRFQRINFWMQNHKEVWKDSTFGRDRLCQEVGLNRHLILQSIRSQGFNNVHEYISSFRVAELKRMIARGDVNALNDTLAAGFGTIQTVRACFLKVEGITLDEYLAENIDN
jgi:AraC-like DNA-binding protein